MKCVNTVPGGLLLARPALFDLITGLEITNQKTKAPYCQ